MKKTFAKIAAIVSAAVLCAVPMNANAAFNKNLAQNTHLGDVNNDGVIDAIDASTVLSWVAKNGRNCNNYVDMARVTGEYAITREDGEVILQVYAQRGARKNLVGDANNDGKIDISDAVHIQLGAKFPEKYTINNRIYADVNRDNIVNEIDSNLLQRYLIKCFNTFEINFGDVNGDNILRVDDAVLVTKFYGKEWNALCRENFRSMSKDQFIRADADGDGQITQKDQKVILNAIIHNGYVY